MKSFWSSLRLMGLRGAVTSGHMAVFSGTDGTVVDGGAPGGGGSGTVTNTGGALTADQLVLGAGGDDIKTIGTAGTTTTVLHGGAPPTYGAVSLTADVSGDLPFSSFVQASGASVLAGRGSAGGAGDFQEITLGSGVTMTGTVLSATGSGGSVTTTGSPASGNLTKFSGATSITNGDLSGDVTTAGALTATIANDAVTYAKMQNISAASKLLGRGSAGGSGDPEEITLGTGLSMSSTTLSATGTSLAIAVVASRVIHGI